MGVGSYVTSESLQTWEMGFNTQRSLRVAHNSLPFLFPQQTRCEVGSTESTLAGLCLAQRPSAGFLWGRSEESSPALQIRAHHSQPLPSRAQGARRTLCLRTPPRTPERVSLRLCQAGKHTSSLGFGFSIAQSFFPLCQGADLSGLKASRSQGGGGASHGMLPQPLPFSSSSSPGAAS